MIAWKDKKEFWIAGAKIADPEGGKVRTGCLLVRKGEIAEIAWQKSVTTDLPVLDAAGMLLAPGFIDIHTHLREPGHEEKETIATGTAAAAAGGFTAVCCMANTEPVVDDPSVVEFVIRRAEEAGNCRVYPIAATTKGLGGEIISEYRLLQKAGAVALSDDGVWVKNGRTMRTALEYAGMFGMPVISHCEEHSLTANAQMHEGFQSTRLGLKGWPAAAEEIAVDRDVRLAALTGSRLHLAHLSTAESIKILERAKKAGVPVTAEVTPHHLTMDHTLLETYDRNLKVNPPLRSGKDVAALRKALRSGTIDCIATDHAPHTDIDKQVEFNFAPPGMIGLQTAFALLHTELVLTGDLELIDLVRLMTLGPAEVLGLPGGRLQAGAPADLVLVDPEEEWTLEPGMIRSISRNTPLIGRTFTGRVQGIFLEGSWRSAILE